MLGAPLMDQVTDLFVIIEGLAVAHHNPGQIGEDERLERGKFPGR